MTTTLRIQTEAMPLTVELPAIAPMNHDDFAAFCAANRELRIERTASGDVIVMPPASSDTGHRNFNLAVQLGIWAERDGRGLGFDSSAGFTLPNGAIRAPDAAWMTTERWNTLSESEKASFAPLCPDFVIELRSGSDTLRALQAKMQEYIDNGASLGWLLDPKQRTVHVYRPDRAPQILDNPDCISGDPELPGFTLSMEKIW